MQKHDDLFNRDNTCLMTADAVTCSYDTFERGVVSESRMVLG